MKKQNKGNISRKENTTSSLGDNQKCSMSLDRDRPPIYICIYSSIGIASQTGVPTKTKFYGIKKLWRAMFTNVLRKHAILKKKNSCDKKVPLTAPFPYLSHCGMDSRDGTSLITITRSNLP